MQQILSEDASPIYKSAALTAQSTEDPYDILLLEKLRGLYKSCMNEGLLDARGSEPLLNVIQRVRKLFSGEASHDVKHDEREERKAFTAALAYLHSQGDMEHIQLENGY